MVKTEYKLTCEEFDEKRIISRDSNLKPNVDEWIEYAELLGGTKIFIVYGFQPEEVNDIESLMPFDFDHVIDSYIYLDRYGMGEI